MQSNSRKSCNAYRELLKEQDVASLMLLLKELIPNYSPGSKMLKAAMQVNRTLPNRQEFRFLPGKLREFSRRASRRQLESINIAASGVPRRSTM